MSKPREHHEQQQADEFEHRLGLLLAGEPLPATDDAGRMARQLVDAAQQAGPRPAFERALRAQLLQKAALKAQAEAKRPPWWAFWQRSPATRRVASSLAGVAAVAIIAVVGWSIFSNRPGEAPETIASLPEATETPESTVVVEIAASVTPASQPADLPAPTEAATLAEPTPLPATVVEEIAIAPPGLPPFAGGMGGGGGDGAEYLGPFVNATITLNAALPEIATAPVFEAVQTYGQPVDVERLRVFAEKVGVSGTLYFDWYAGMPIDGNANAGGPAPNVYRIFDGNRRVTAYDSGEAIYENLAYSMGFSSRPLAFAENAAIAERVAQEWGLVDFPYVLHASWGYEVQFLELVDGRPVNIPRLTMTIAPDGEVATIVSRASSVGGLLREESLRSAQEAWVYLESHLQDGQFYFSLYASNPDYYMPVGLGDQKTHWQRDYAGDETVQLTSWVSVYRPIDGSGPPLLIANNNIRLTADEATLEAMATATTGGVNLRLVGTISGPIGEQTLAVASWDSVTGPSDLYLGGTTRSRDGQVVIEVPGGYPFPLAGAPADLPLDTTVNVYATGIRADEAGRPILEWTSIDLWYMPAPLELDYAAIDPFVGITSVVIDRVQLGYQQFYPGEMLAGTVTVYNPTGALPNLVPVWVFTGQTNKGDTVEFMIPAPSAIELQQ
jgi:hypothetical protein